MQRLFSLARPVAKAARSSWCSASATRSCRNFPSMAIKMNLRAFHMTSFSAAEVSVPLESLGDSITTATVVTWHKNAGDAVAVDDTIATVDTDKVSVDIKAKVAGVFGKGLVEAGAEVEVGADLYTIDADASAAATAVSAVAPATEATSEQPAEITSNPGDGEIVNIPVPIMGESITTGTLAAWSVKIGSSVDADEVVAVIDTDKVTVDVKSPFAGKITAIYAQDGEEVEVGKDLFELTRGAGSNKNKAAAASTGSVSSTSSSGSNTSAPAQAPTAPAPKKAAPTAESTPSIAADKSSGVDRSETRVKMTRMRLRIAQRLKEAQGTAAMLTTFQECDMSNLIDMRNKYKDQFEKVHGVKLGFMSAFVQASTLALREVPAINSMIDDETKEIVYRNYCDISVAVASPTGLVVPVLRNTENMTFADVEKTIGMYGKKAKEGSLALEEMAGGTFTISNGGVFGSLFGTPIINPPQSAILGMHATKMRAMVVNGKVEARPMMYLALTYDHRLIDGREAVTFLKSVASKIEDPSRLLLNL